MPNPVRQRLVRKRFYKARAVEQAQRTVARLQAELASMDWTILANGGPIKAYRPAVAPAIRGDAAKTVLAIQRQAGRPMTTVEILHALAGQGWGERVGRGLLLARVRMALGPQLANGVVRREVGLRPTMVWSVAA